jgi:hypothetical protein
VHALGLGLGNAFALALGPQLSFKLCDHGEHAKECVFR